MYTPAHIFSQKLSNYSSFLCFRYHSLCIIESSLDDMVIPIAWTDGHDHALSVDATVDTKNTQDPIVHSAGTERILMGARHKQKPHFGVQFHPESIATAYGHNLLSNFQDITLSHVTEHHTSHPRNCIEIHSCHTREDTSVCDSTQSWCRSDRMLSVCCKKAGITLSSIKGGTQRIVEELYLDVKHPTSSDDVFWLDSSSQERSRFSFIGGRGGRMWKRVSYAMHAPLSDRKGGELIIVDVEGKMERIHCDSIWDWISQQSREFQGFDANLEELPFGFWGGLVGYLGYELKAESGGTAAHISPNADACFFIVDRYIAVDHKTGDIYIVALYNGSHNRSSSEMWVDLTMSNLENLKGSDQKGETRKITSRHLDIKERHSGQRYSDKIEKCLEVGIHLEYTIICNQSYLESTLTCYLNPDLLMHFPKKH